MCARDVGADNMRELMKDRSVHSLKYWGGAKDKYLDGLYGRESKLLIQHFSELPETKWRQFKLFMAILILLAVNVALYAYNKGYIDLPI